MKEFWRWMVVIVTQQCECIECQWTVHLKVVKMVSFMLCTHTHQSSMASHCPWNKDQGLWCGFQGLAWYRLPVTRPSKFSSLLLSVLQPMFFFARFPNVLCFFCLWAFAHAAASVWSIPPSLLPVSSYLTFSSQLKHALFIEYLLSYLGPGSRLLQGTM